ncbi:hypothetical protein FF52_06035 [Flavobacterium sp. F52]|nr:hypothetical protein FF52_06035 [Flavobacterium sp. F52]
MNINFTSNAMNELICHFLSTLTDQEIVNLFNGCISAPNPDNAYALIYNSADPQFYFTDTFNEDVKPNSHYILVGLFYLHEINDLSALKAKVQSLKTKWCGS